MILATFDFSVEFSTVEDAYAFLGDLQASLGREVSMEVES